MLKELGFYKGVNLGGWFSQCDYSRERLDTFITEPDFAKIAGWGFDHVRIPIDYNVIQNPKIIEAYDRAAHAEEPAEKKPAPKKPAAKKPVGRKKA